MEVIKRTPRVELNRKTILARMGEVFDQVVEELGAPRHLVDEAMSELALVSVRVKFAPGEIDFEPILPADGPDTVRQKWTKYLDTESMEAVHNGLRLVRDADRPLSAATAPTPPKDQDSKD